MGLITFLFEEWMREIENRKMQKEVEELIRLQKLRKADAISSVDDEVKCKPKVEEYATMEDLEKAGLLDKSYERLEKQAEQMQKERLLQLAEVSIKHICLKFGATYEIKDGLAYIKTDSGSWYFDPLLDEHTLYHKNYALGRHSNSSYHHQYTKKETIEQTMFYIIKHDKAKSKMDAKRDRRFIQQTAVSK